MAGMSNGSPVVVVGAGQAGLAVSYELTARGIEHVVLERARVGQSWLGLWDSFRLVTPNWTMSLPGAAYAGDDPEGFVPRDEIVRYLQGYASSFGAPVREGVGVDSLEPGTPWASRSPTTGRARWCRACSSAASTSCASASPRWLFGVGEDAAIVAQSVARHHRTHRQAPGHGRAVIRTER